MPSALTKYLIHNILIYLSLKILEYLNDTTAHESIMKLQIYEP
jgi:hypothetical protein